MPVLQQTIELYPFRDQKDEYIEGSECSSPGLISTNSPSSLISLANLLELAKFEERAESNSSEFAEFVDEVTRTGEVKGHKFAPP